MLKIDVLIIGAGAAGLMCAIEAGKRGRNVIVLDHANKPGKKILMSGGGRCNFTNLHVQPDRFISHNPHFCKSALSRYTQWDFLALVKKYGIAYHEKTLGQLFCDDKAKEIVNMLLAECATHHVNIHLNESIKEIKHTASEHFVIQSDKGQYQCDSLVIATGGLSIPTMGATPFGYQIAAQFNHKIWPTSAGLVPLTLHNHDKERLGQLSGISQDCLVTAGNISFRENMLFTHRGLSGPAILQISNYWRPGEEIEINFCPMQDLSLKSREGKQKSPKRSLKEHLSQFFAKKMVSAFLSSLQEDRPLQSLTHAELDEISHHFQRWRIKPNGTEGYRTAEVTLGGVDCDAISSKTMESRLVKGLYFIGEVLDVTGWLGGYNFQWAWSSGWAAGQAV